MALVGGGGSGFSNTVNPSGTGTNLNYIGEHAFAYSGEVAISASSTADTTMLKFATGNEYVVGKLNFSNDSGGSSDVYIDIKIDGQVVFTARYSTAATATNDQPLPLLIPPYAKVEVIMGSDGNENMTAHYIGRVYA